MEKNYWAIHMGRNNMYADIAYKNNFIGIGWGEIGKDLTDFRELSNRTFIDKISPIVKKTYENKSVNARGQIVGQLFRFSNLMRIGDIVLVPHTQEGKVYVGRIDSEYFYLMETDQACPYQHRRKVAWIKTVDLSGISQDLRNSLGSIMTVFSITNHWQEVEKLLSDREDEATIEDYEEFGLESHLEDFLVENWNKTKLGKKYSILKEGNEIIGQQYITPIGRIDLLARSKDDKEWLVIELKKGKSDDQVVGQVLRYVGWIQENEARKNQKVKGMIIAKEKSEKLLYAIKTLRNVSLMTYSVKFNLREQKNIED